jgi:uncharacterized protein
MKNIRKLFDYSVPAVASATVAGVVLLIVALLGVHTVHSVVTARDVVEVTGSAKQAVDADTGRLVFSLETTTGVNDQDAGFVRLQAATERIQTLLTERGFENVEAVPMSSFPQYTYPQYGTPLMTGYTVQRQVFVRSEDIVGIEALANNVGVFAGTGYTVSVYGVEYTYSKLADMRVSLLSEAIADARARAEAIAKDSGRSIGTLRTASSGVVQVLAEGATDISDYGSYDTQSKRKEVMVTVRATFEL